MPEGFAEIRNGAPAAAVRRPAARIALRAAAGIALAGATLAGCSSSSETSFSIFAEPGRYQYYNCAQMAVAKKGYVARRQELKTLMDRADQSTGGAAVGFIAYKAEYVAVSEELESLDATARSKSCAQDEPWRSNSVIR
jgi:hypothetical protein